MKEKIRKLIIVIAAAAVCVAFGAVLGIYTQPMEDLSLDLSLFLPDGASPEDFDDKGWTVFTQEGDTITVLEPDGFGSYTGLELGQTFYFSRVLADELDSPTLQLGVADRNYSVFLDDELIYTDCPELDNRIGYLTLPMRALDQTEPITISLPANYYGKTLTIAQSSPEYSETSTVRACPCSVMLYCGFAYESSLISESFQIAFSAILIFAAGVLLMAAFCRNRDVGALCVALVAFLWMTHLLTSADFFYLYFGADESGFTSLIRPFVTGALLLALSSRAGKGKKAMLALTAVYGLSLLTAAYLTLRYPTFVYGTLWFLSHLLHEWIAFGELMVILILSVLFWRKENRFYRLFTPLVLASKLLLWTALFLTDDQVGTQLGVSLSSGQITNKVLYPFLFAAMISAVAEAVKAELNRRTEKQLFKQQHQLALAGYENLRRQQEEVMMLRHDMVRHFHTLREMSSEHAVTAYLTDLIGQNEKIRPVVRSGNEMLDIILNGKLSAAVDAGVKVEILRAEAPPQLPLRDADLCSLVMNVIDNAVTAAIGADTETSFVRLDIHTRNGFLAFVCENSANMAPSETPAKTETVPEHGLGLKIIRSITAHYEGIIDTEQGDDFYKVRIVLPLS